MSARISVRLQPRAGRDEIVREQGGTIVVRVTAPPVDGRANDALCRLVAERVHVPRGAVRVVRGEKGRDKVIEVEDLALADVRRALGLDAA